MTTRLVNGKRVALPRRPSEDHQWVGNEWRLPDPEQALAEERQRMVCSRMQATIALARAGELEAVEEAIAKAPLEVRLAWENAQEFKRLSPTILALARQMKWGPTKIDGLFRLAMTIEA